MRRSLVLLLFATIFVAELGWAGIAPLLPDLQDRYGLTDTTTRFILSVAGGGVARFPGLVRSGGHDAGVHPEGGGGRVPRGVAAGRRADPPLLRAPPHALG